MMDLILSSQSFSQKPSRTGIYGLESFTGCTSCQKFLASQQQPQDETPTTPTILQPAAKALPAASKQVPWWLWMLIGYGVAKAFGSNKK